MARRPAARPAPRATPSRDVAAPRLLSAARWVLLVAVLLTPVTFWHPAVEPFMLPKATLLLLGVGLSGALALAHAAWTRTLTLPRGVFAGLVALWALALLAATVTSPTPGESVIGHYGRYGGLAPYLGYLAVLLLAARLFSGTWVERVLAGLLVTLAVVTAYGLLQRAGHDPFHWLDNGLPQDYATFGNIDFAAGYVGALLPLTLWAALRPTLRWPWRLAAALVGVAALGYAVVLGPFQGPVVGTAGLALVALGWLVERGVLRRLVRARHARPIGVALLAAVLVLAGLAGPRLLAALQARLARSFVERRFFYQVAGRLFRDHPVLGTGLDTFGQQFTRVRPAGHVLLTGSAGTDSAHSVPLQMLSDGGLVLGLSYLALMVFLGVRLVQALRVSAGEQRMLVVAVGAVWLGYQVQSLVSIDVPPLALLNYLSGGLILALAGRGDLRVVRLPGAAAVWPGRDGRGHRRPVRVPAGTWVAAGLLAVVFLVAAAQVTRPLRADLIAASAAPAGKSGQLAVAIADFDAAIGLNPYEPSYRLLRARALYAAQQGPQALASAEQGAARDPGNAQAALFTASLAAQLGRVADARHWYAVAVSRDPLDPQVLLPVAAYYVAQHDAAAALPLLHQALAVRADAATLVALGQAEAAVGDKAAARAAFQRALVVEPTDAAAKAGLQRLGH